MNKHENIYQTKALNGEVKDFDTKTSTVKMAVANMGSLDSKNQIIDYKAFDKTLSINRNKWHFINHNADAFTGKIQNLYTEGDLLIAIHQLDIRNNHAKNLLLAYEKGEITEHSIGFQVPENGYKIEDKYILLTEVQLWEVSSLTVPAANPLTPFLGFKSLVTQNDIFTELIELQQRFYSKKSNSEEKQLIKLKIKQLHQMFFNQKSIAAEKPQVDMQPQIIEKQPNMLLEFYKQLKIK